MAKPMKLERMKMYLRLLFQQELNKVDKLVDENDIFSFLKKRSKIPLIDKKDITPVMYELSIRRLESKIS